MKKLWWLVPLLLFPIPQVVETFEKETEFEVAKREEFAEDSRREHEQNLEYQRRIASMVERENARRAEQAMRLDAMERLGFLKYLDDERSSSLAPRALIANRRKHLASIWDELDRESARRRDYDERLKNAVREEDSRREEYNKRRKHKLDRGAMLMNTATFSVSIASSLMSFFLLFVTIKIAWSIQLNTVRHPVSAEYLLYVFLEWQNAQAIAGDLVERHAELREVFGRRKANVWYWKQVVWSMGPLVWAAAKRVSGLLLLWELQKKVKG